MINWVLRDESLHLKFGMNLIHNILEENPELLTDPFLLNFTALLLIHFPTPGFSLLLLHLSINLLTSPTLSNSESESKLV